MKISKTNFELDPESGERYEEQVKERILKLDKRVKAEEDGYCCGIFSRLATIVWGCFSRKRETFLEEIDIKKELLGWRFLGGKNELSQRKIEFQGASFLEKSKIVWGFEISEDMKVFLEADDVKGKNGNGVMDKRKLSKLFSILVGVKAVARFFLLGFLTFAWVTLLTILVRLNTRSSNLVKRDEYLPMLIFGVVIGGFSLISMVIYWYAMWYVGKVKGE